MYNNRDQNLKKVIATQSEKYETFSFHIIMLQK